MYLRNKSNKAERYEVNACLPIDSHFACGDLLLLAYRLGKYIDELCITNWSLMCKLLMPFKQETT